jgi:hypothetical protein
VYVPLKDHEDIWKIGNSERDGLRRIWNNRHKVKKTRKARNQTTPNLVTSEAHTSHRVLRYEFHMCLHSC